MTDRAREADVLALIDHELRFLQQPANDAGDVLHSGAIGTVRHCNYVSVPITAAFWEPGTGGQM